MKKQHIKKLKLRKESLRAITPSELHRIGGGGVGSSPPSLCLVTYCAPSGQYDCTGTSTSGPASEWCTLTCRNCNAD